MTVIHKRSSVAGKVPTAAQLAFGEIALNTADGKLYLKKPINGVESVVDFTKTIDGTISIGECAYSNAPLSAPQYLELDGAIYLRSSYPELANLIGNQAAANHNFAVGFTMGSGLVNGYFDNGRFYLLSVTGFPYSLYSSTNGTSWALVSSGRVEGQSLAFKGSIVVAGRIPNSDSTNTTPDIQYSLNGGQTWTKKTNVLGNSGSYITHVFCANGIFVVSGVNPGAPANNTATSTDGVNWTVRSAPVPQYSTNGMIWSGGQFVALNITAQTVQTSPDGVTWTTRNTPGQSLRRGAATNGRGTVILIDYQGGVIRSKDGGISWTKVTTVPTALWDNQIEAGVYADDGDDSYLFFQTQSSYGSYLKTVDEGQTFERIESPAFARSATYGNGVIFLAMDYEGRTGRLIRPFDVSTQFTIPKAPVVAPGNTTKMYVRAK